VGGQTYASANLFINASPPEGVDPKAFKDLQNLTRMAVYNPTQFAAQLTPGTAKDKEAECLAQKGEDNDSTEGIWSVFACIGCGAAIAAEVPTAGLDTAVSIAACAECGWKYGKAVSQAVASCK
jgi:hypothetical protein